VHRYSGGLAANEKIAACQQCESVAFGFRRMAIDSRGETSFYRLGSPVSGGFIGTASPAFYRRRAGTYDEFGSVSLTYHSLAGCPLHGRSCRHSFPLRAEKIGCSWATAITAAAGWHAAGAPSSSAVYAVKHAYYRGEHEQLMSPGQTMKRRRKNAPLRTVWVDKSTIYNFYFTVALNISALMNSASFCRPALWNNSGAAGCGHARSGSLHACAPQASIEAPGLLST
jgi:hypothetical protein